MVYSVRGELVNEFLLQIALLHLGNGKANTKNNNSQVIPSLYLVGVVMIQRRFGSELEDAKGDYVVLVVSLPDPENETEIEKWWCCFILRVW